MVHDRQRRGSRLRKTLLGVLVGLSLAPAQVLADDLEDAVLEEINFARTNPQAYARQALRAPAARGGFMDAREQDPAAFEEAIDFLMRQRPLPPLRPDERLAGAAREHVQAQGPRGSLGHGPPGGQTPGQRMQAHGLWAGLSAESISYGFSSAREVVLQLVVDADVPGRGHRRDIFGASFQLAGVACGGHRAYGTMCVIDFAGAVARR